jgi:membrane protease YdiL (CAAX protease family)
VQSRTRRIATFYVVTFVVTHLITTAYRLRGGSWNSLDTFVVANGIMLIPGLVALIFTRWILRAPVRKTLGLELRPNRWWLAAWLLPPVLMLLTLGASLLVPGTSYDPTMSGLVERLGFTAADGARLRSQIGFLGLPPLAGFLAQALIVGPTLGLVGGLGEELAWRGLLHHELMPAGFWRCTAITGVLWALWHVPLTLQGYGYPNHPLVGTLVAVVYILLFAPLLTFIRLRGRSVLAPAILHGTADGTVLLTLALVRGGGELTTGWGSLSSIGVLAIVDLLIATVAKPGGQVPVKEEVPSVLGPPGLA